MQERGPMRASRPASQTRELPAALMEKPRQPQMGFDGKALLRDLDLKFESQDKLLNYMM